MKYPVTTRKGEKGEVVGNRILKEKVPPFQEEKKKRRLGIQGGKEPAGGDLFTSYLDRKRGGGKICVRQEEGDSGRRVSISALRKGKSGNKRTRPRRGRGGVSWGV